MNLTTLEKCDRKTAEGILAAAAFATAPDAGVGEAPNLLRQYASQADDILAEVRNRLHIGAHDDSARSRAEIDKFLANALSQLILSPDKISDALARVGQSGRLSPALYQVDQPPAFKAVFYGLGVNSNHVDDAVRHPDDHQHLMPEGLPEDSRTLSLFMKLVTSKEIRKRHWFLVQSNRNGYHQVVTSAWRIYPNDVDLLGAKQPIDVLKAFVQVFGCPIRVGESKALFVDTKQFPFDAQVKVDWTGAPVDSFFSFSQTSNAVTSLFRVGIAYCIDLAKYRAALKRRGVNVTEPSSVGRR
jgi:hypothetical protein